jgi:putative lipoic acid-binding regulatory protein
MSQLLEFPCDFPLKVFGHWSEGFDAQVASVVRRHAPDLEESAVVARPSKAGRYLAVTVALRAESQAQLDAIYRDLGAAPGVVMIL